MPGLADNLGASMQDELLRLLGSANDSVGLAFNFSATTTTQILGTFKEVGGDRLFGANLQMGPPTTDGTVAITTTHVVRWVIEAATSANTTGIETVALVSINPTNIQFSTTCGTTFLQPFRLAFRTPTGKKFIRTSLQLVPGNATATTLIMASVSVLLNPIHDTVV